MNRRRALPTLLLCLLVLLWLMRPLPAVRVTGRLTLEPADNQTETVFGFPGIGAAGAAVMEVNSFRLLGGRNLHQQLPMASTTKIMTAILAIESGRLQETVVASPEACKVEPSSIWLAPGERIKLEDLVYGLMLRSGNDAAHAIAEFLGGTVEGFVQLMNEKAASLDLHDTHFANPHGLPNPDHYTSAYDLAKLAAYALQNPEFSRVVSTKKIVLPWDQHDEPRVWYNKNRLLTTYPGADGVKTGWTSAAGYCLVGSAERAGMRVVAVVLNSPDDFGETARMMDYAFANYVPANIVSKGQYLGSISVARATPRYIGAVAADSYVWPVGRQEQADLSTEVILPLQLSAPLRVGERVGTLRVLREDECLAEIPLVADQSAERNWWQRLLRQASGIFWQLINLAAGGMDR
jgi:D-alanyl-D-alanine carboxypeptidase